MTSHQQLAPWWALFTEWGIPCDFENLALPSSAAPKELTQLLVVPPTLSLTAFVEHMRANDFPVYWGGNKTPTTAFASEVRSNQSAGYALWLRDHPEPDMTYDGYNQAHAPDQRHITVLEYLLYYVMHARTHGEQLQSETLCTGSRLVSDAIPDRDSHPMWKIGVPFVVPGLYGLRIGATHGQTTGKARQVRAAA